MQKLEIMEGPYTNNETQNQFKQSYLYVAYVEIIKHNTWTFPGGM